MSKRIIGFTDAVVWRICLFLAICLNAFVVNAGEPIKSGEAEYSVPKWVGKARHAVNLPPPRSPFEYRFLVKPDTTLHFNGNLAQASATNYNNKAGIFVINFYDVNHNEVATKALRYSSWLKGYASYLGGSVTPVPFYFSIEVPTDAVETRVRFARLNPQLDDVSLMGFSHVETPPTRALRNVIVVYGLFAFSLIAAWTLRRKAEDWDLADRTIFLADENMMRKLCKLCVVALAIIMACVFLREVSVAIELNSNLMPLTLVLGFVMLVMLLAALVCSSAKGRVWLPIIIMAICLIVHVTIIHLTHALYSQTMCSDFSAVESVIKAPIVKIVHTGIFYWANYEFLCSFLGKLFGKDIQVAQYLNALCCTATVYPVFMLSHRVGGDKVAVLTSLLMALSPITQLYGTILTNEFVAAAAYGWAVYFIVRLLEEQRLTKKCGYALWCGVFLGIGNLVKPFAIIFIVATVVVVAVDIMKKITWRYLIKWLVVLPLLFGSYLLTSQGGQNAIMEVVKPQVMNVSKSSVLAGTLLIGLHVETQGRYNRKWIDQWRHLSAEGRISLLKYIIKKDFHRLPALFLQKLDRTYSDPRFGWSWYSNTIKADVPCWVKSSVCIWNLLVLFLIAVGIVGFVASGAAVKRRGFVGMISLLVVFAFTVTLLLTEAQPRYKTAIYPVFFFLIPYARFLSDKNGLLCKLLKRCLSVACKSLKDQKSNQTKIQST